MGLAARRAASPWLGYDWAATWDSYMRSGSRSSRASEEKRVTAASNCNSTVPVGPWRCLPMMTSALPCTLSAFRQPFGEFLAVGFQRLAHLVVVFLAVDEQHHVGVLLDRAGFTQVRKLRPLVVAAFHLTRQLRQRQDRHVEFLRQRLELGGDLGDFLHAVFLRAPGRALQQAADSR